MARLIFIYQVFMPVSISLITFLLYINTHPSIFPYSYDVPEDIAFVLTLIIACVFHTIFSLGYLIIKRRINIDKELGTLVFLEQSKLILVGYFNNSVFIIIPFTTILSSKLCYEIYEFFMIHTPEENLGFGMTLFFIMPLEAILALGFGTVVFLFKKQV